MYDIKDRSGVTYFFIIIYNQKMMINKIATKRPLSFEGYFALAHSSRT